MSIKKTMSRIHWNYRKKGRSYPFSYWAVRKKQIPLKFNKPWKDSDRDGVINKYDCQPLNKWRQDDNEHQLKSKSTKWKIENMEKELGRPLTVSEEEMVYDEGRHAQYIHEKDEYDRHMDDKFDKIFDKYRERLGVGAPTKVVVQKTFNEMGIPKSQQEDFMHRRESSSLRHAESLAIDGVQPDSDDGTEMRKQFNDVMNKKIKDGTARVTNVGLNPSSMTVNNVDGVTRLDLNHIFKSKGYLKASNDKWLNKLEKANDWFHSDTPHNTRIKIMIGEERLRRDKHEMKSAKHDLRKHLGSLYKEIGGSEGSDPKWRYLNHIYLHGNLSKKDKKNMVKFFRSSGANLYDELGRNLSND